MGDVFLATDTVLNRLAAIKLPRQDRVATLVERERFLREARTAASLDHPSICRVYEAGEFEDSFYIVMEYVSGRTLADILHSGEVAPAECLRIALEAADALREAHSANIVHRDLKPSNIMIDAKGRVKLMDFGLARSEAAESDGGECSETLLTVEGAIVGTRGYMSPEQTRGQSIDARSDIFSFGVVLYEMLTGRNPFQRASFMDSAAAVLTHNPPPVSTGRSTVPARWDSILARALAKNRDHRFASMDQMLAELRQLAEPRIAEQPTTERRRDSGRVASSGESAYRRHAAAERRHIAIVSCTLAGFRATAARLDPEDQQELVEAWRESCRAIAREFGGGAGPAQQSSMQFYFGYPMAWENNTERAAGAAIAMRDVPSRLQERFRIPKEQPLSLQAGIHCGIVLAEDPEGGPPREIVGHAPDLALWLDSVAGPGRIALSGAARNMLEGLFALRDLGNHEPRGGVEGVQVFELVGPATADAAPSAVSTPLVGRDRETMLLLDYWERVRDGMGQVVVLSGEPGIGKTRMTEALRRSDLGPHTRLEGRCSAWRRNTALHPVIELVERLAGFEYGDAPPVRSSKLERILAGLGIPGEEPRQLLHTLLTLALPAGSPPPALTPEERRRRSLDLLLRIVLEYAQTAPVLLIVEDVHWVDATTLEWLGLIAERIAAVPVMLVLTCRPEFRPSFAGGVTSEMRLGRLTAAQVRGLIEQITGGRPLPAALTRLIAEKTDGVPLFVEQVTRMALEAGWLRETAGGYELTADVPVLAVPETLQDSLMARLDRLGDARFVAQVGSILGREFRWSLLAAVWPFGESSLRTGLDALVRAELLTRGGSGGEEKFIFRHALIQDAAYQSQVKGTRQEYHGKAAEALERLFPRVADTDPELLAWHYTAANSAERAIFWWQRAAQRAIERSAHADAVSHLNRGLEVVRTLPESRVRDSQELALQIGLGAPLIATRGYAAAEVEEAFSHARALCGETGDELAAFRVRWGLGAFSLVRARLENARRLLEDGLAIALRNNDPALILEAESWLGAILFYLADPGARAHLERAAAIYESGDYRTHAFLYGLDPGVLTMVHLTWTLWLAGECDAAMERDRSTLLLAEQTGHPLSYAHALNFSVVHHCFRGEADLAYRKAEEELALSRKYSFPHYMAYATILQGWALASQGSPEAGIRQIREGLQTRRAATGAELARPLFLTLLASTLQKTGEIREAQAAIDEAKATIAHTGERWWNPEVLRLEGELMLASDPGRAREILGKAAAEAEAHGSVSLQRRIAVSRERAGAG
jgi:TOMM system kinase/cyclase fusion protein